MRKQCSNTRDCLTRANSTQPLLHENAVVVVKRHNICNRTQSDKVEKLRRNPGATHLSLFLQHFPECSHDIKRNANPRQIAAREGTADQIRIDDHVSLGKFFRRQVMIGYEYGYARLFRGAHARKTRNTVVDCDDQLRRSLGSYLHDLR